ncbi:MAG TPA: YciI family protein [Steroidobacteraceae bacterium]
MLITVICLDKIGHVDLRMRTRAEHLKWLEASAPVASFIGPIIADNGDMIGSLYIAEFEDLAAARAFQKSDPYEKVGLFERVVVQQTRNIVKPP